MGVDDARPRWPWAQDAVCLLVVILAAGGFGYWHDSSPVLAGLCLVVLAGAFAYRVLGRIRWRRELRSWYERHPEQRPSATRMVSILLLFAFLSAGLVVLGFAQGSIRESVAAAIAGACFLLIMVKELRKQRSAK